MKVIMVDRYGVETLVCESIDQFHGHLFVSLLNDSFSAKNRKVRYKVVELDHELNKKAIYSWRE